MLPRLWRGWLVCCVVLLLAAGCGYQFTGTLTHPMTAGQTIWIPFISNESISPTAQTVVRRALYDECHALRGLVPANYGKDADLTVKGRLVSYSSTPLSYSAVDRASEFNLTIEVELELYKRGRVTPLWKGIIPATKAYPANPDLSLQHDAEESALDAAARTIAHKFIAATEQTY